MFEHHGPGGAVTATGGDQTVGCVSGPVGGGTLGDGRRSSGGLMEMPFGLKGSEDTSTGGMERCEPSLTINWAASSTNRGVEAAAPSVGGRLPMAVPG